MGGSRSKAHQAHSKMVSCVFIGSKAVGAWRSPTTQSSPKVKERVELYLYFLSGPSWLVLGLTLPLPFLAKK